MTDNLIGVVRRMRPLGLAGALSLALVAACGSQSPEASKAAGGGDAGRVTFTEVYGTVLKSCTSCHAGLVAQFIGLDMGTQATAYGNLVGAQGSGSCGGRSLVVRGSAATSLLYEKVTSPPCGSLMPQNAPPLPQASIDLLKTWIDEGAADN